MLQVHFQQGGVIWKTLSVVLMSLPPLPPPGDELLYRNRDGDVVKLNVDTDEKTVLVHNKKFVSLLLSSEN